ncbi:MAG: coenzyme F420-0:L-glutamate ligase [Candidatus Bathyarchaeota archaeon]|nr:coenzyme F420-0:L-glutamate ligase [Candidatus Bathyarchaeota archaeon]MDH5733625.1 coenzyme F420-0:L-glutamate ligase [Candidatus Bathyarchaeota archaeon]
MQSISIVGLENFPFVNVGDNIAEMIVEIAEREDVPIDDGNIIVIAQKVVSKAEGRVTELRCVKPSGRAEEVAKMTLRDPKLVELALKETKQIVKASRETLIVENKRGLICINSGIDKSNVPGEDSYALLPENSDRSAEKIRSQIFELTEKKVAVIICDTYSRPFRRGQVEFAIGIAGINPFKDYRGQRDLFDYVLKVKNVALVDEIACAAELVMGQGDEGIPVAIVKNVQRAELNGSFSAQELNISKEEDLFKGTL